MTVTGTQGTELQKSWFNCKMAWSSPNFAVIVCVRQITAKKFCEFGKHGLFENLLSLL